MKTNVIGFKKRVPSAFLDDKTQGNDSNYDCACLTTLNKPIDK